MINKLKTIPYDIFSIFKKVHSRLPYYFGNGYAFTPLRVNFEVTHSCNLKCEMCYLINQSTAKDIKIGRYGELTVREINTIINQFPKYITLISFSGGEPFIRKDFIDILKNACSRYKCNITTNATLINDHMANALVEMDLVSLNVSIDGSEEIHDRIRGIKGSYKKSLDSIMKIQEIKKQKKRKYPFINIKTTITPNNIHMFSEILDLAEKMNADFCSYQIMNNSINTSSLDLQQDLERYFKKPLELKDVNIEVLKNQLSIIEKKRKHSKVRVRFLPDIPNKEIINHYSNNINLNEYICHTPWSLMCISPNGFVFPCFNYRVGDLKKDRVMSLWNNINYRNFRKTLKNKQILSGCIGCCYLEHRKYC